MAPGERNAGTRRLTESWEPAPLSRPSKRERLETSPCNCRGTPRWALRGKPGIRQKPCGE